MAIVKSTQDLISQFEGKRNTAYKDSKGLWTIGVGHLIKEDEPHLLKATLTDEEVFNLFKADLSQCDAAITANVKVPLNQNQYDALYSLCFNIGASNFAKSEVVKNLNAGNYQKAADAILNWNKPIELVSRRKKERALFLTQI
jgi:lysozyme